MWLYNGFYKILTFCRREWFKVLGCCASFLHSWCLLSWLLIDRDSSNHHFSRFLLITHLREWTYIVRRNLLMNWFKRRNSLLKVDTLSSTVSFSLFTFLSSGITCIFLVLLGYVWLSNNLTLLSSLIVQHLFLLKLKLKSFILFILSNSQIKI